MRKWSWFKDFSIAENWERFTWESLPLTKKKKVQLFRCAYIITIRKDQVTIHLTTFFQLQAVCSFLPISVWTYGLPNQRPLSCQQFWAEYKNTAYNTWSLALWTLAVFWPTLCLSTKLSIIMTRRSNIYPWSSRHEVKNIQSKRYTIHSSTSKMLPQHIYSS